METIDLNEYSKLILSNFEKDVNSFKEDLFNKIHNSLNSFKNEISSSTIKILENIVKAKKSEDKTPPNPVKDKSDIYDKNLVKINVGGTIFITKTSTLLKYPNSKLSEIFLLSKKGNLPADYSDGEGLIFFDRNPRNFEFVLDAIRNGKFIETSDECVNQYIQEELRYFNLENLLTYKESKNEIKYVKNKSNLSVNNEHQNKLPKIAEIKAVRSPKKIEKRKGSSPSAAEDRNNNKKPIILQFNEIVEEENESLKSRNNRSIIIKKIMTNTKFEFDENYKNANLKLSNENQTVENVVGWEDAAVLGNIEMSSGKFQWEIFIEDLAYNNWMTIGVADKSEISKEMRDEHINSFSISSTKESWRMDKPIDNLSQTNSYFCYLDFEKDLFRINGPGVDCKNIEPVQGKKLFVLVNVFNSKNKLTIRNFVCLRESN